MTTYLIKIEGVLDDEWSDWLEGLTITPQTTGETWLKGQIIDQTALHGIFKKLRDLGVTILFVKQLDDEECATSNSE